MVNCPERHFPEMSIVGVRPMLIESQLPFVFDILRSDRHLVGAHQFLMGESKQFVAQCISSGLTLPKRLLLV